MEKLALVSHCCSHSGAEQILMMILLSTRATHMVTETRLMDFYMMNPTIRRPLRRFLPLHPTLAPCQSWQGPRLVQNPFRSLLNYPHHNPPLPRNPSRPFNLHAYVPPHHHGGLRCNHQVRGMVIYMMIIDTRERLWSVERGGHLPAPVYPPKHHPATLGMAMCMSSHHPSPTQDRALIQRL